MDDDSCSTYALRLRRVVTSFRSSLYIDGERQRERTHGNRRFLNARRVYLLRCTYLPAPFPYSSLAILS